MQSARAATQFLVSCCHSSLAAAAVDVHLRSAAVHVHCCDSAAVHDPDSSVVHVHCCNVAALHDPDSSAVHADADSDSADTWLHLEAAVVLVYEEFCQAGAAGLQWAYAVTEECQAANPVPACPGRCQRTLLASSGLHPVNAVTSDRLKPAAASGTAPWPVYTAVQSAAQQAQMARGVRHQTNQLYRLEAEQVVTWLVVYCWLHDGAHQDCYCSENCCKCVQSSAADSL